MAEALQRAEENSAADFLAAIADPRRPTLLFRTAIVVAHPDDETIGCGALLPRLPNPAIFHVTDGAPRNRADAKARGLATAEEYAAVRRQELEQAVGLAGIGPNQLNPLGWPDQEASAHIAEIARELAGRLSGTEIVLTHAYEGGHPDHDATALAVHAACALLSPRTRPPAIIETPLYRAGPDGRLAQCFEPWAACPEVVLDLSPEEQALKQAMFAAHRSQEAVLTWFTVAAESYRRAPEYDFSRLPNRGTLLYEQQEWGMTGARWLELAHSAVRALGLGTRL